jgi:acyl-CoA synthetase (AMP-forming)/AMP-acid ligase II
MTRLNPYDVALAKNPANYAPLTPLSFLKWSARVCPDRVAVVHADRRFTWAETYARARRLASALSARGVAAGDTVTTLLPNTQNISSLEVEDALHRHAAVFAAAVVAEPHEKWGETPCAFVELKPNAAVTELELMEHCRQLLAHFKVPRRIVFGPIPKTATGKIQKFVRRERAKSADAIA